MNRDFERGLLPPDKAPSKEIPSQHHSKKPNLRYPPSFTKPRQSQRHHPPCPTLAPAPNSGCILRLSPPTWTPIIYLNVPYLIPSQARIHTPYPPYITTTIPFHSIPSLNNLYIYIHSLAYPHTIASHTAKAALQPNPIWRLPPNP